MGKQQFSNEEIREAIKELLSGQKVELGVKDYKPLASRMEKINSNINKNVAFQLQAYEKLKKGVEIAKNDSLEVKSILQEARSQYKKDIQAAKELGVDDAIFKKTFELIEKLAERSNKDIAKLKVIKQYIYKKYNMKPFTKETIDTIIRIGGNGTLKHLK